MLSRRNREPPPSTTEPTSFAGRAKDLGALRDAVVDAAGVGTGLWLSYLFVLFYFAIAAGAVTHRDLLLENPVKLPFLNVELPLKAFFVLGPLVFLIVHAYVLLHFVLLAGKLGAFHSELEWQVKSDDTRAHLRRQLPSNIFVQSLAGPRDVREGPIGFLLRLVIRISLIAGPIALLVLFQLQFLPYHSEWITNWQRIAVLIDLALLWILWPPIARVDTKLLGFSDFRRPKIQAWAVVSVLPILLVVTIATFPGEWLEENLPPVRLVPTTWKAWTAPSIEAIQRARSGWATLHELLVAGYFNLVTDSPKSLCSNVLVLPDFKAGDRVKFDAESKISIGSDALSLRGRDLQGAVFIRAHLDKADFTGAQLQGATFNGADLREAKFKCDSAGDERKCAELQGASLDFAQLQGADLKGAQLQGATLFKAQLQGASLEYAQLQGAFLDETGLWGADLNRAQLQGASLFGAQLQGAVLVVAQLQGASLDFAQLQGVLLDDAELRTTSLIGIFVWRARGAPGEVKDALIEGLRPGPKYQGLDCPNEKGVCDWSDQSYGVLKSQIEQMPSGNARDQALKRIEPLGQKPYEEDPKSANAWRTLEQASNRSAETYPQRLAETLIKLGCDAAGPPYVIGGIYRRLNPIDLNSEKTAEIAAAFLNESKCPGARGLSAEDRRACNI